MFDMNKFKFSGETNRGRYYNNDLVDFYSNVTFALWSALESLDFGYCGKDGFIQSIRDIHDECEYLNSIIYDERDKYSDKY